MYQVVSQVAALTSNVKQWTTYYVFKRTWNTIKMDEGATIFKGSSLDWQLEQDRRVEGERFNMY